MGTPSPEFPPDIEAGKWYCCLCDEYWDNVPEHTGCEMAYLGRRQDCVRGVSITTFFALGGNCKSGLIWSPFLGTRHRLLSFTGPYDTQQDCIDECP